MVIDPGMMEAGGHHAALLETLCESEKEGGLLQVFSHTCLDERLASKATECGIKIHRHFETNFYQHYDDSLTLKVSGIQSYVRYLAQEYMRAFELIAQHHITEEIVCFYPCLNWEHASGLSLALSYVTPRFSCTHKVCCMFTPLERTEVSNLYYKAAFNKLSGIHGVEMYASDWETGIFYTDIGVKIKGFHPCYLLPWDDSLIRGGESEVYPPHFLLYVGDAKENKGFTKLPKLVELYVKKYEGNVKLTIQFTLSWEYPELLETIKQLDKLNERYKQLNLYKCFWSTSTLTKVFSQLTGIVCTYNVDTYQNKSSGLTWLATFFDISVVVSGSCWVSRELARLGRVCSIDESLIIEPGFPPLISTNSDYYQKLFKNLITWFKE